MELRPYCPILYVLCAGSVLNQLHHSLDMVNASIVKYDYTIRIDTIEWQ